MTNYENIISKQDILKYGKKARRDYYPKIQGNCGLICDRFEGYLIDFAGLPYTGEVVEKYGVIHIRVGPNGEEKHFVFHIDGECVEGYFPGEEILIDLSFDQFNNNNKQKDIVTVSYGSKQSLDNIRIMKPDDERLSNYMRVGDFFNRI